MAESEDKSEQKPSTTSEETSSTTTGATSSDNTASASSKRAAARSSKSDEKAGGKRRAEPDKKAPISTTVNSVRSGVATAVWLLAVLAAVILAVGALMITLDFNQKNGLVEFFTSTADNIDFGLFKEFKPGKGETAADVATKNALVNWGIAALIYLVAGKILERLIRP